MILLNLNGREKDKELICPHCERPMSEHGGVQECGRGKVSRRFFMGGLSMAAAGTAAGIVFTKKAEASLGDYVTEPVVARAGEVIPKPGEPILQVGPELITAAPRVYRGGPILIETSGTGHYRKEAGSKVPLINTRNDTEFIQKIADAEGREVIFRDHGVVRVAKPSDKAWSEKWESPSLAHYDR